MCRIILAILIGCFCSGPTLVAQTRRVDSPEVLKQLLARPAPTPRHAGTPEPEVTERPPVFFERRNAPADDAPIEDIVAYWARSVNDRPTRRITDTVRQRLLDLCFSEPKWLITFWSLLPETDTVRTKVKELYDRSANDEKLDEEWRLVVKDWLIRNSTYYLDELLASAQKVKENEREGNVRHADDVTALAKLNWSAAEPLLRGLMATGQSRTGVFALSLFYDHAVREKDLAGEERYRRDLQAIAFSRASPAFARTTAITTLAKSEWSGRDEWYLALFQDPTLINLTDAEGTAVYSPLITLYSSDLDKWIPVMTRLLKSDDINVRSAAADCLMTYTANDVRKEALLPLLPWLSNSAWLTKMGNQKLRLIETLGEIDLPESVPGLISVVDVEHSDNSWEQAYAARALARYKDPRAVPALKRALAREKIENLRSHIFEGLLACDGFSKSEQLQAVEAYASKLTTEEGRIEVVRDRGPDEEPLSLPLSLGKYLATLKNVPGSLVDTVLVRAESLSAENPPLSKKLVEIAHEWQGSQIDRDMIRRIANGSADAKIIEKTLSRRSQFDEELRSEAQGLAAVSGAAQGVGAVLLDDALLADGILNGKDQPAKIGLLASARMVQMPLPLALVGPLLESKDPLLALAAENYLLAEDSREARDLLWQRHANEAFVTGWLETLNYPIDVYTFIRKTEAKLRAELLEENGPVEILALIPNEDHQATVVRIYRDKAVYTQYEDPSRYRERAVAKAEVSALKDFLTTSNTVDRGPSLEWCHHGCTATEFLSLTKEKGRRVFSQSGFNFEEIWDQFGRIGEREGIKTHYTLEKEIKGLEVLYATDEFIVNDVALQGTEVRVLLERVPTEEELDREEAELIYREDQEEEEGPAARLERRRLEAERHKARFSWRVLANNQLGAVTSQPDFYPAFDGTRFITDEEEERYIVDPTAENVQVLTPDSILLTQDFGGLWKHVAGGRPVRIHDGLFTRPIVTRDRKWVVLASSEDNWSVPNSIVRFNLQTGREYRVNLEPADDFEPVAFVASHNKVLLRRAKAAYISMGNKPVGPERPEYFLLDAATGETRLVNGEFAPLQRRGSRPLQRTEKPDEFWVALSENEKNKTRVGRYNTKDFSFKPVMEIPHLVFDSMNMWIDANAAKIYVVYKGQLVRLPLQVSSN